MSSENLHISLLKMKVLALSHGAYEVSKYPKTQTNY